jgi:hypothetical protein
VEFTGIEYVKRLGLTRGRITPEMLSRIDKALEDVQRYATRNRYAIDSLADAEIVRIEFPSRNHSIQTVEFQPVLSGRPIDALTKLFSAIVEAVKPFGWLR